MFIRIKNYDPAKHDEFENQAHFDFSKSGKIKLFGEL
jgi:hypothetical protein